MFRSSQDRNPLRTRASSGVSRKSTPRSYASRVPSSAVDVQELVDRAEERLLKSRALDHWQSGRERIDAEDLLTHVLGDRWKAADEVPPAKARRFMALVERHFRGEPVPYILGYMEFRGLKLSTRTGVFV